MSRSPRNPGPNAAWEAGMSFVAGPVIGYFIDEWLATTPWFLLGFTLLGAVAGFRRLFSLTVPSDGSGGSDGNDGGAS